MIGELKSQIKSKLPFLVPVWHQIRTSPLFNKPPKAVFSKIYRENLWGDEESISGAGSNLDQTEVIRNVLPLLLQEMKCKSLLDVPCGDFNWMKLVELDVDYIGGDIVDELIESNQEKYGSPRRRFVHLDLLIDELPTSDLLLCRDCLVHLSQRNIFQALRNIKNSGIPYLLTTTFIDREQNTDILTGEWRTLNLQLPPYSFPKPIKLINEECPWEGFGDKSLGLWKTETIPNF